VKAAPHFLDHDLHFMRDASGVSGSASQNGEFRLETYQKLER
jgi:hypothetical protein